MLERKLKNRIIFLASKGDQKQTKNHILAMDVLRRAPRFNLEEEGLVCGDWIDISKLATIHRVWEKSDLETAFKIAALQDESWSKEDAEQALKLLHTEDVDNALRLIVKNIDGDIAVQSFKLTLVDPDFKDIYVNKITYHIPRETWLNGFVETWAKELEKQGVEIGEDKTYFKQILIQILGGLGE